MHRRPRTLRLINKHTLMRHNETHPPAGRDELLIGQGWLKVAGIFSPRYFRFVTNTCVPFRPPPTEYPLQVRWHDERPAATWVVIRDTLANNLHIKHFDPNAFAMKSTVDNLLSWTAQAAVPGVDGSGPNHSMESDARLGDELLVDRKGPIITWKLFIYGRRSVRG